MNGRAALLIVRESTLEAMLPALWPEGSFLSLSGKSWRLGPGMVYGE